MYQADEVWPTESPDPKTVDASTSMSTSQEDVGETASEQWHVLLQSTKKVARKMTAALQRVPNAAQIASNCVS
jgi:hypothetical protein